MTLQKRPQQPASRLARGLSILLCVALLGLAANAGWAQNGAAGERDYRCARWTQQVGQLEILADRFERFGPRLSFFVRWFRSWAGFLQVRYTDRCIAMNEIQSLGSHNSYHIMPRQVLFDALVVFDPQFLAWEYTHSPLDEQFSLEGVRQIELDVFHDPAGGLYQFRPILDVIGDDPIAPDPAMADPGFKVLHVQDLDFETTCTTFVSCLTAVRDWSDANPNHLPIAVLVELKDDPIPDPLNLGFVTPLPIGPAELDLVDAEIRSVFDDDHLIRPDHLRVPGLSLEQSILQEGWPTLGEARGRIIFLMDNRRDDYVIDRPNLEDRVMFTNSNPGQTDGAFVKRNSPTGSNEAAIQTLVQDGYLVRTRADSDTNQARSGDTTQRDAALRSGAHFISSDYPSPDMIFGTGYQVTIPGGEPSGCNPINGRPGCRAETLEP